VDTLSHTTNPQLVNYRNRYPVTEHRGMRVQDIPTDEVQIGDRLCCWLSDASAYPEVTGWSNRELDLGYLGHPIHREFTVTGAPWWCDKDMTRSSMSGRTYILALSD
jgi:hypothetical protein